MPNSFGLLKGLSVVFKVLACLIFVLMLVGLTGTLIAGRNQQMPIPVPVILNTFFSGILAFLLLFTFGEVIRLLLAVEAQTRKS